MSTDTDRLASLGKVTQVSPLKVRLSTDLTDTTAEALDDFTGSVVGTTEVLVWTVEGRRFAARVH